MVNITYNFNTFNDFKNALEKMREYMRRRGWNNKPQLSDMMWGEWIGAGCYTPYIQLKQNFDERHRDHFEITIRKLTKFPESEESFDKIALECNVVTIQNIDKVDKKPYGFVQRALNSWVQKQRLCVCCGSKWDCDFGHNPAPACDYGRCCDKCNQTVICARAREAGLGFNFINADGMSDDDFSALKKSDDFKAMVCALLNSQMESRGINFKAQKKW